MHFSSRLDWNLRPNRLSEMLAAKRSAGSEVLDLTESNPTRAGFEYPREVIDALSNPASLIYEPSPMGALAAREAVALYYAQRGRTVPVERILLTASTSEAYSYAFKLFCDPADEVLVPRPSYPLFEYLAALESVRFVPYPLVYHGGWSLDLDRVAGAVSPRTRALVVVNPNNPTGTFLRTHELEALVRLGLPIISDEVFADYTFTADPRRVTSLVDVCEAPVIAMSGLSKIAGLPQMKLGWMIANRPDIVHRLELIADTYLSVSTPVQHAAARLIAAGAGVQRQIAARVRVNLDVLRSATGPESPFRVLDVQGGWYATVQAPRIRSEEEWVLHLLSEHDVLVQPGFFYDFENEAFLVLSLLTRRDAFAEGVRRLVQM